MTILEILKEKLIGTVVGVYQQRYIHSDSVSYTLDKDYFEEEKVNFKVSFYKPLEIVDVIVFYEEPHDISFSLVLQEGIEIQFNEMISQYK